LNEKGVCCFSVMQTIPLSLIFKHVFILIRVLLLQKQLNINQFVFNLAEPFNYNSNADLEVRMED